MIGYVLIIIGLAIAVVSLVFPEILDEEILPELDTLWIIIPSLIVIAIGFLIVKNKSPTTRKQRGEEVPIYKGNEIIGYRKK